MEELRQLGHDVLTTAESGRANKQITDDEVLAFAAFEGRAVLTLNRKDFRRLHQEDPRHAGVVICTYDSDFAAQAVRIHQAISSSDDLAGRLIRVNRPSN